MRGRERCECALTAVRTNVTRMVEVHCKGVTAVRFAFYACCAQTPSSNPNTVAAEARNAHAMLPKIVDNYLLESVLTRGTFSLPSVVR